MRTRISRSRTTQFNATASAKRDIGAIGAAETADILPTHPENDDLRRERKRNVKEAVKH
jgi:hypothetical protein